MNSHLSSPSFPENFMNQFGNTAGDFLYVVLHCCVLTEIEIFPLQSYIDWPNEHNFLLFVRQSMDDMLKSNICYDYEQTQKSHWIGEDVKKKLNSTEYKPELIHWKPKCTIQKTQSQYSRVNQQCFINWNFSCSMELIKKEVIIIFSNGCSIWFLFILRNDFLFAVK